MFNHTHSVTQYAINTEQIFIMQTTTGGANGGWFTEFVYTVGWS